MKSQLGSKDIQILKLSQSLREQETEAVRIGCFRLCHFSRVEDVPFLAKHGQSYGNPIAGNWALR